VKTSVDSLVEIVKDYSSPRRIPVLHLIIPRPVRIDRAEPRRWRNLPIRLPMPAISLGLADAHLCQHAFGPAGALLKRRDLLPGESRRLRAVGRVIDHRQIKAGLANRVEIDVL